jgi:hypothetical protein
MINNEDRKASFYWAFMLEEKEGIKSYSQVDSYSKWSVGWSEERNSKHQRISKITLHRHISIDWYFYQTFWISKAFSGEGKEGKQFYQTSHIWAKPSINLNTPLGVKICLRHFGGGRKMNCAGKNNKNFDRYNCFINGFNLKSKRSEIKNRFQRRFKC